MIISCSNISKSFGETKILKDITFKVENNEKIGIVGVNGAGKSTLMKIFANEYEADSGDLFKARDIQIGYLSQTSTVNTNQTIVEALTEVFADIILLEKQLHQLEESMSQYTGPQLEKIMDQYATLQHIFTEKNGYGYKAKIRSIAKGLGFDESELERDIATLSGGEKTRVALARLLLLEPNLLLLDEPTNHLDIKAIEWLEGYIKGYKYAVVIICHDRYFLDHTVSKIIDIQYGKSKVYSGNYSFFASQKAIDRQTELNLYINQQKEIERQEEMIRRIRARATKKAFITAKSKEKRLAMMEKMDRPESLPKEIRMMFDVANQSGFDVLSVNHLSKSFGTKQLFHDLSFQVKRNEYVAILGENGIGKTTLLKILLSLEQATSGSFRLGSQVSLGYYDQEQVSLSNHKTIFSEIQDSYPQMSNQEVRNILATFQFRNEDVFKQIAVLSGGEKARVVLTKLLLKRANFLLLDEPTNHLDISSKEILEEALLDYQGTMLFISHDRYFINKIATKIIEMKEDRVNIFNGSYEEYIEKRNENTVSNHVKLEVSDYQIQKQQNALKKKKEREILKLEERISELEKEIDDLNQQLTTQEVIDDYQIYNGLIDIIKEKELLLNSVLLEWEELNQ